MMVQHVMQFA